MDLYREEILEHYKNPHNFGRIAKADVVVREANALCGDMIEMSINLGNIDLKEKTIKDVKFKNIGCAISTASSSLLTDYIKGRKISFLKNLTEKDILSLIGVKITPARVKCALLPLITLKKAINEIQNRY